MSADVAVMRALSLRVIGRWRRKRRRRGSPLMPRGRPSVWAEGSAGGRGRGEETQESWQYPQTPVIATARKSETQRRYHIPISHDSHVTTHMVHANQIPSKLSRRQKRSVKKAEEVELYQKERSLLEVGKGPESAEDFDRLLVATPNQSSLWVQYMAFHLHMAEVDKARAVAQRALRTISFRYE